MSAARIQLKLDVNEPIELVDLTLSFQALAFEYRKHLVDFARSRGARPGDEDVRLYITNIESGCIFAELGSATAILGQLFSVMDYTNIFIEFTKNIGRAIQHFQFLDQQKSIDPDKVGYSKTQCARIADLLDVVSKNKDGALALNVIEYEDSMHDQRVHLRISFSSEEAYSARRGALKAQKALEATGEADHKQVIMYFWQTNVDDPKEAGRTGDKAIIKAISDKPLRVYFVSKVDREKIKYLLAESKINPFKASFIVDANVETDRNDVPRQYRVMHVHEIIPGEEEESDLANQ